MQLIVYDTVARVPRQLYKTLSISETLITSDNSTHARHVLVAKLEPGTGSSVVPSAEPDTAELYTNNTVLHIHIDPCYLADEMRIDEVFTPPIQKHSDAWKHWRTARRLNQGKSMCARSPSAEAFDLSPQIFRDIPAATAQPP